MTVMTTDRVRYWNGNGVAVNFPFQFRLVAPEHLKVYLRDPDPLNPTNYLLQTLGVDYTIQNIQTSGGGDIIFTIPPLSGVSNVRCYRMTEMTQDVDYITNDDFPAETHEFALDKLTLEVQDHFQDAIMYNPAIDAWDAEGRRIVAVGDPVGDSDAITKAYADSHFSGAAAAADADRAEAAALAAKLSEQAAQASATIAEAQALLAELSATDSGQSALNAKDSETAAVSAKDAAEIAMAAAEEAQHIVESLELGLHLRGTVLTPFVPVSTILIDSIDTVNPGTGYSIGEAWYVYVDGATRIAGVITIGSVDADGRVTSWDIVTPGAFDQMPDDDHVLSIIPGVVTGSLLNFTVNLTTGLGQTLLDIPNVEENNAAFVAMSPVTGDQELWMYVDKNQDGVYNWVPGGGVVQNRNFSLNPITQQELALDVTQILQSSIKTYITAAEADAKAYAESHPGYICFWLDN
jgi:hypothetical protein